MCITNVTPSTISFTILSMSVDHFDYSSSAFYVVKLGEGRESNPSLDCLFNLSIKIRFILFASPASHNRSGGGRYAH